ncbi:MAG: 3-dehydroquinate synthase [Ignisphaera sp.]|uniref:3-dehydroquinate synthase n=1 Tax=Ignisphaera aggregans TaxID=334771 RepID=A0A7C4JIC1_9CREN
MNVLEEEICCRRTKVVVGRNAVEYLRNEVRGGKVILIKQKAVDVNRVVKVLDGEVYEITLEGVEQDKDIEKAFSIVNYMYSIGMQRNDYVVAVGGGTLTDVAGFISSLYMRGVKLVNIPTTLLGMVDAALGGKNGVNFRGVKNIIGTFYQPDLVVADLGFLDTLPQEEYLNGLAEVVKYGISLDRGFFDYLRDHVDEVLKKKDEAVEYMVYRSMKNKLGIVKEDPLELKGVRIVLNFGHTFGHAIESASGFTVKHGKAVALGMAMETMFGVEIGATKEYCIELVVDMLRRYDLPTSMEDLEVDVDMKKVIEAVNRDKKRYGGSISMPILIDIGSWIRVDVPLDKVVGYLSKWIG